MKNKIREKEIAQFIKRWRGMDGVKRMIKELEKFLPNVKNKRRKRNPKL